MQTVDKAMRLLQYFTISKPELGLSELARLASFDKAATRRFLVALSRHNLIEQNPDTRKYRLGSGFLRFSNIREAMFPVKKITQPLVDALTEVCQETSHSSVLGAGHLTTVGFSEPVRGTIAHIDAGEPLPLHATASGIVFLAFSNETFIQEQLEKPLIPYSPHTIINKDLLLSSIIEAKKNGYRINEKGFEDEVSGIAVPFFNVDDTLLGTMAVACPSSRLTNEKKITLIQELAKTANIATRKFGGKPPVKIIELENFNGLKND